MNSLNADIRVLSDFLRRHHRIVALTGAGISAASGIPTYRDAGGTWRGQAPVQHQEFVSDPARRRRYWARSLLGWPAVRDARPNAAHLALARLQHHSVLDLIITQNVDRLHQRAGSQRVVDLHGRLDQVRCLSCDVVLGRETLQHDLLRANPGYRGSAPDKLPDGDVDLPAIQEGDVEVPDCARCGGVLMPDVIFFGGSVPRSRVQSCGQAIRDADALLAVGTSLQVYSGFRFCRLAAELDKPIALINPGKTRADPLASVKLTSDCGPLLGSVVDALSPGRPDH
jgi:NAD-dependent SIR2 family protein deacetylase